MKPGGTIGKPAKGSANKTFVISHKSEEERAKDLGSTMTMAFWVAIALFAAAVGVLMLGDQEGAGLTATGCATNPVAIRLVCTTIQRENLENGRSAASE